MSDQKLPNQLRERLKRYGHYKTGPDLNNCSEVTGKKEMVKALEDVEDSLNSLSDALKNRFKELLISQLSLLRAKQMNTDIKAFPSQRKNAITQGEANTDTPIYENRSNLKEVQFLGTDSDTSEDNMRIPYMETKLEKKSNLQRDKNLFRNEFSPERIECMDIVKRDSASLHPTYDRDVEGKETYSPVRVSLSSQFESKYGSSPYRLTQTSPTKIIHQPSPVCLISSTSSSQCSPSLEQLSPTENKYSAFGSQLENKRSPSPVRLLPVETKCSRFRSPDYSSPVESKPYESRSPLKNQRSPSPIRLSSIENMYNASTAQASPVDNKCTYTTYPLRISPKENKDGAFPGNLSPSKEDPLSESRKRARLDSEMKDKANEDRYCEDLVKAIFSTGEWNDTLLDPRKTKFCTRSNKSNHGQRDQQNSCDTQSSSANKDRLRCSERTQRQENNQEKQTRSPKEKYLIPPCCSGERDTRSQFQGTEETKVKSGDTPNEDYQRDASYCHSNQQIGKKMLLNAIATLICVVQNAVIKMFEEDFDLGIWTAIHKNVVDMEEELEKFNRSITSDNILPPKMAVKEAENRLKTRMDILFNMNMGRLGFSASNSSKKDIMETVKLLKSSSYRAGMESQNDMLISEMRQILTEIKNLSECFQVCGARFVKRLKEDSRESVKSFIDSSVDGDNFSSAKQTICSKIFKCILAVLRKLLTSPHKDTTTEDYESRYCIKRSSSLEALEQWAGRTFDRLSDVQQTMIILCFVVFMIYTIIAFLTGLAVTFRSASDMLSYVSFHGSSLI